MKALSKKSTQIFLSIIASLNDDGYVKVSNSDNFMPLSVERIEVLNKGTEGEIQKISFAHYSKQNGDLMADPEMIFIYYPFFKKVVPCYYKNDYMGFEQESITFDKDSQPSTYYPSMQVQHVAFASEWLNNIMIQQKVKI